MALTPNAWNCPKVSIPGQGDLHAPLCDISRDNWELWKLRPANLSFAVYHVHFCAVLYYLVFWGICMKSVSTDRDFGNFFHRCHRPPQSPCRRRSTDRRCGPAPMRGSDVVISVYICECGVLHWTVKLGTRWPILGLGRDYLLLGSALWNLRWKCSCLSRNENKEFIFVSVKVVMKMPCDRIRGWSRLIKSEFCLDEKFVKCSVVITSCRTGIKMSPLPRSAFLKLVTCKYE